MHVVNLGSLSHWGDTFVSTQWESRLWAALESTPFSHPVPLFCGVPPSRVVVWRCPFCRGVVLTVEPELKVDRTDLRERAIKGGGVISQLLFQAVEDPHQLQSRCSCIWGMTSWWLQHISIAVWPYNSSNARFLYPSQSLCPQSNGSSGHLQSSSSRPCSWTSRVWRGDEGERPFWSGVFSLSQLSHKISLCLSALARDTCARIVKRFISCAPPLRFSNRSNYRESNTALTLTLPLLKHCLFRTGCMMAEQRVFFFVTLRALVLVFCWHLKSIWRSFNNVKLGKLSTNIKTQSIQIIVGLTFEPRPTSW